MTHILVSDPLNIRYITGMSFSSGLLLVKRGSYVFFTDSRYLEVAKKLPFKDISVKDLEELPKVLSRIKQCGFEANHVTVARLKKWKAVYKGVSWKPVPDTIEQYRRSKDAHELTLLHKAERITEEMLNRIPKELKSGVTEQDIATKLETWARELGAESLSFEPIVAFGSHSSRPHHHPTSKKLKKRDIVQIDVGAKYKGYCADRSEVFFVGQPTARQKIVYEALEKAKNEAKKVSIKGASVRKIDAIATKILKEYDIDEFFTHALGHGVGLDIHEGVVISTRAKDDKLLKGEVITIEPGVYFEGKWGMRLEDMVYVQ